MHNRDHVCIVIGDTSLQEDLVVGAVHRAVRLNCDIGRYLKAVLPFGNFN
jgi:hypothetical protein